MSRRFRYVRLTPVHPLESGDLRVDETPGTDAGCTL
jgi:hypothetical protein